MNRALRTLLLCALCALCALPAFSQVKNRWRLEWTNDKPRLYTFQNPLGEKTHYVYVVYTVKNPTAESVPLAVDVTLHTDHGGDLHHDVRNAETPVAHPGKWYADTFQPVVEIEVIKSVERLGNRSPGHALDRIAELKKEGRYLNPSDLRARRIIRPGETLGGVALFADVDLRTDILELNVAGLIDIVRIDKVAPEGITYAYDSRVKKIRYDFSGDEFERHNDTVVWTGEEWAEQPIGPVSDKSTVGKLIEFLAEPLDAVIRSTAIAVLKQITPVRDGFGFDPAKTVEENLAATRKWNEWWVRNAGRLVFDPATNSFAPKEEVLPATLPPFPDEAVRPN